MWLVWRSVAGTWKFARGKSPLFLAPRSGQVFATLILTAAVACAAHGIARAQDLPKYEVTGFRGATFGMTERDVQATIVKTLGVKASDVTSAANPVEGTTVLTAKV